MAIANDLAFVDSDLLVVLDDLHVVESPEGGKIKVMAMVTPRVGRGVVFTPFHFGGWYEGKDLLDKYPEDTAPYVRGEAANTVFTYGYDSVTTMQETKATLCKITAA